MTKNQIEVPQELLDIPGMNPSKAKSIHEAGYGSIESLRKASIDDISKIKGINKKLASDIYEFLHNAPQKTPAIRTEEDVFLESGLDLYKQGKWGQALQIINDVLEKNPHKIAALNAKAQIYLDREKFQLALDTYDEVTSLDPEIAESWVGKGNALLAMDQKTRALSCFKKALTLDPTNEVAQEKLGEEERLPTFVDGLDAMLEGGIPSKHIVMICGRAGSMKSSFAYYMLHKLSEKEGRKTIYLSLEQSRQSLLKHMKKLGLKKETAKNLMVSDIDDMVVVDMAALRKETDTDTVENIDWPRSIINQLKSYRESYGCDAVVIDSLSALYSLHTFKNPRSELFFFFERLRDIGITVFLISEMYGEGQTQFGQYGVEEFLVDGIIHLKTEEYANRANLFLGVVKMRETNHPRDYFPLIVDQFGFGIVRD
ncbi:MAG: ATPase domain-containing protein [Thermoplasmata archaeon]|nr:ATPase domain-containing protein [Thermoplasmata archaeon]